MVRNLVILGVTGSIGKQTLDVIRRFPDHFQVRGISAYGHRIDDIITIVSELTPDVLVVLDEKACSILSNQLTGHPTIVMGGAQSQIALASGDLTPIDMLLSGVSGTSGLIPTMAALERGIPVALANKETLVAGGELVMSVAARTGATIFPVDSEHSAIFQCLMGISRQELRRIILTCSGGPFSLRKEIDLSTISAQEALAHPTWNMGKKITIDSSTLMNKGLEVIEARWLFDIDPAQIDIVIHPQSIIHSMIETIDGSIMAQLAIPDMRLPILYALNQGEHCDFGMQKLDLTRIGCLTFFEPDFNRFPCLGLAYQALREGETMPAVLNGADEVAVEAFCQGKIGFTQIPEIIERVMMNHIKTPVRCLDDILNADISARTFAEMLIRRS